MKGITNTIDLTVFLIDGEVDFGDIGDDNESAKIILGNFYVIDTESLDDQLQN